MWCLAVWNSIRRLLKTNYLSIGKDTSIMDKSHAVDSTADVTRALGWFCDAPTVYFPLLVPECLLIEPAETESKETLDRFVAAMKEILDEIETQPETVKTAPHAMPLKKIDDVKAARELDLVWNPAG